MGPCFKSYLCHKFDRPETIRDRAKMNLAGHRVGRLSGNYFEPCVCCQGTIQAGLLILQGQRYTTFLSASPRKNSRTSRKRPAKLPRFSGRLREYKQTESPPGTGDTSTY